MRPIDASTVTHGARVPSNWQQPGDEVDNNLDELADRSTILELDDTITLTSSDQASADPGPDVVPLDDVTGSGNVTVAGNTITIATAGKYVISAHVTMGVGSGAGTWTAKATIRQNGVAVGSSTFVGDTT